MTIDKKIHSQIRTRQSGRPGRIASTAIVEGKPNYLYVDFLDGAPPVACWNPSLPPVPGLHVLVQTKNGRREISADRDVYSDDYPYALIKYHGPEHTWPGFNFTPIHIRQILPGLVTHAKAGGMAIDIQPRLIYSDAGWTYFRGVTNRSIASFVPASGACYLLVSIDDAGNLSFLAGSPVTYSDLTYTNIPAIPDLHEPIAIIRLLAGQTTIRDISPDGDIIDPRFLSYYSGISAEWGNIEGDISTQTDLINLLDSRLEVVDDLSSQIDGVTDDFTLSLTLDIESIYYNGQRLYDNQYSLAGAVLTLTFVPAIDDTLVVVGLTYANLSVLVPDADANDVPYLRQNNAWLAYPEPADNNYLHQRRNGGWVPSPATVIRLSASPTTTTVFQDVSSTAYTLIQQWAFSIDIRPFRYARILVRGGPSESFQSVTFQLATKDAPGTPFGLGGDDLVIENPSLNWLEACPWFDLGDVSSVDPNIIFCIAAKGSNSTVDFLYNFVEVQFK